MRNFLRLSLVVSWLLWSESAQSAVRIEVRSNEAANVFEVMDNTSNWWPGFCREDYEQYWRKRFGITGADRALFAEYASLRNKYYHDPNQAEKDPLKNTNGLFTWVTTDRVAETFYSAKTLEDALLGLKSVLQPNEITFLRRFYKAFESKYLFLLRESVKFQEILENYAKKFDGAKLAYLDKMSRFYHAKTDIHYQVIFVWYPPGNATHATPVGHFLIMQYNPIWHFKDVINSDEIVFHEIIHTVSASQTSKQKQTLTRTFLKTCDPRGRLERNKILEEPLAVVFGQMIFLQELEAGRFDYMSSWYNHRWTNLYAKLLLPVAREQLLAGKTITDGFIVKAATLCDELFRLTEELQRKPEAALK